MTDPNCPFCPENGKVAIIAEETHTYLIAVLNGNQEIRPGCYFIIPKQHTTDPWVFFRQPGGDEAKRLFDRIPEDTTNFNLNINHGHAAGQRVPHVHMWVVLRNDDPSLPAHGMGLALLIRAYNALAGAKQRPVRECSVHGLISVDEVDQTTCPAPALDGSGVCGQQLSDQFRVIQVDDP